MRDGVESLCIQAGQSSGVREERREDDLLNNGVLETTDQGGRILLQHILYQ